MTSPQGWQIKTLEELCEIARGGSPRPIKKYLTDAPDGVNWIKIGDASASSKYIYKTKEKIKPEGVQRSRLVEEGDFILSNSMSFGRPYIMKTRGCIHDGWLVLRDKAGLFLQDYLYYFLGSPVAFSQFDSLAAGSTVRNLNITLVKSVKVIVPPLPQQKRIVAILDDAFARIDAAIANTEKNIANTRELFESYLNGVFDQKGDGWEDRCVEELCDSIIDCINKTASKVDEETPFKMLRTTNIRNGLVSTNNVKHVTEEIYHAWTRRQIPAYGDVLLTREAPMGEVGILLTNENVFLGQRIVSYRVNSTKLDNRFLLYAFQSSFLQKQMNKVASGSTVQHIRVPDTKKWILPTPSLEQQALIADNLDRLKEKKHNLERLYQQKLTALQELKQAILQKAFSGELTAEINFEEQVA